MNFSRGVPSSVAFSLIVAASLGMPKRAVSEIVPAPQPQGKECRTPASAALSEEEMRSTVGGEPIDAMCYVAGACLFAFPPFGVALCGPTAVVCTWYYWNY